MSFGGAGTIHSGLLDRSGALADRTVEGSIEYPLGLTLPGETLEAGRASSAASGFLVGRVEPLVASIQKEGVLSYSVTDPFEAPRAVLQLIGQQDVGVVAPPEGVTEQYFAAANGFVTGHVAPGQTVTVTYRAALLDSLAHTLFDYGFSESFEGGENGLEIGRDFGSGPPIRFEAGGGYSMHLFAELNIFGPNVGASEIFLDPGFSTQVVQTGPATSVPEPSSAALIGTGLVGLIGYATRRRGAPPTI
jgi:hypothetical protein